ncbi:MAG TPA: FAD-binding oxidoreductase [Streptosporangiaceae bacterium]|jgi:hypothetical protein
MPHTTEPISARGPVIRPGDDAYDAELRGFQLADRHEPDVIAGAADAGDVRAAVAYAAAHRMPIAVQASGHGLAAPLRGGLLISTRRMTGVTVDPAARTVRAEAGARWAAVITAAAAHGLAPLNGSAPDVGVVGYTLGGGLGLLARRYGYAADHVRAIDVVTPDGHARRATPAAEPDLFWALRGGRGNFGVATAIEMDLVPLTRVYGGGLYHPAEPAVLDAWRTWTADLPDELTSSIALIPFPDVPGPPEPLRGRHIAHIRVASTGTAAAGERLVAPLRAALGPALIDTLAEMPYTESAAIYSDPPGAHAYHGGNALLTGLTPDAVAAVFAHAGPGAPEPAVVQVRHLGGALARPPEHPSAIGFRDAAYLVSVLTGVGDGGTAAADAAHRPLLDALRPLTAGRFLNYLYGAGTGDVPALYEPAAYRRLTELKAAYDPHGLLRAGHDIPPAR